MLVAYGALVKGDGAQHVQISLRRHASIFRVDALLRVLEDGLGRFGRLDRVVKLAGPAVCRGEVEANARADGGRSDAVDLRGTLQDVNRAARRAEFVSCTRYRISRARLVLPVPERPTSSVEQVGCGGGTRDCSCASRSSGRWKPLLFGSTQRTSRGSHRVGDGGTSRHAEGFKAHNAKSVDQKAFDGRISHPCQKRVSASPKW